ncbi:amino acid permease [Laribacter hongkongensis]|uniref:amino acid permease n=1 Tax=Laribacter hongkongensis TaxID=168471 RepID=UPI000422C59A|nr:amino acid permease [Laribacter hongkongensis]
MSFPLPPSATTAEGLQRNLKARHLTMIAIGGAIGTGLFIASGASVAQAGPGGAVVAYLVIGLMVFFLMTSLGEMAAYMPESGSFTLYSERFVDPAFGFAQGWNYWFNWAITIAVELVAAQIVMAYWFPDVPGTLWSLLFLGIFVLLNIVSVKGFGEGEYWFSMIKVMAVVVFLLIGTAMLYGWVGDSQPAGLHNFTIGQAPFVGGTGALIGVAMIAGFSFQGTELVGITAGEAQDPQRTIPKAIKQIFWRILIFYVLSIIMIGLLLPYNDPRLLQSSVKDIAVSPFTLVLQATGVPAAASVMNAVILTAILSAGNSGMYASTRTLHAMAMQGQAPKIFARVSRHGVPVPALLLTTAVSALCFTSSLFGDQRVYLWLVNLTGLCGFIAWLGIAISHYRFRKGFLAQGRSLDELPYRARWFPFGPLFAFTLCLIVVLGQNYEAFFASHINWNGIIATYIGIPVYLAVWLGYRWKHRCRFVRYEDMPLPDRCKKTTN